MCMDKIIVVVVVKDKNNGKLNLKKEAIFLSLTETHFHRDIQ